MRELAGPGDFPVDQVADPLAPAALTSLRVRFPASRTLTTNESTMDLGT